MSAEPESRPGNDSPARRRLGGLLVRRERWCLTIRGRLFVAATILGLACLVIWSAFPFLSCQAPIDEADVLVVEGWLQPYSMGDAAQVFQRGHYRIILTCGDITGDGWDRTPPYTFADRAAASLQKLGLGDHVVAVPTYQQRKDRTYHSALAVRAWLSAHGGPVRALNVVTMGPHARRSRLLFQKAFGDDTRIGVIALDDRDYDPAHWWRTSEGVREILGEAITYLYARLFFWPGEAEETPVPSKTKAP